MANLKNFKTSNRGLNEDRARCFELSAEAFIDKKTRDLKQEINLYCQYNNNKSHK